MGPGGPRNSPPDGPCRVASDGRIISHWQKRDGQLVLEVAIPANTTATVFVPAKDVASVTESGEPAASAAGVKYLRMANNAAVYTIDSGTYRFQSILSEAVK